MRMSDGDVPPMGGLTKDIEAELRAAAAISDQNIDAHDTAGSDWSSAVRGKFYRPATTRRVLDIDADVMAFYEALSDNCQSQINRTLRASMLRVLRRQRASG